MKKHTVAATIAAVAAAGGIGYWGLTPANAPKQGISAAATVGSKAITIYSDPNCGCCETYNKYLEANGYQVTRVADPGFGERSKAAGVPEQGLGCHFAEIDGYVVSGLVPVEIIERLVSERPNIKGITLPGMPGNAPGMARVKTGTLKTFAFGDGGVTVYSNE